MPRGLRWDKDKLSAYQAKQPKNKYHAVKKVVDGITFDSTKEANRYQELKLMEKAGEITRLRLQVEMPFTVNNKTIFKYYADFSYLRDVINWVYEDVKGMKTPVYRLKKKLIEAQYGIRITET